MTNSTQTEEDFQNHLKEQIQFLLRSSQAYDEGYESEAKRLAAVIRILLHDTSRSTSLLAHLNRKDILFYDTSLPIYPNNFLPTMGLLMLGVGSRTGYLAPLGNGPPSRYTKGKSNFNDWWERVVIVDNKRNTLTRKDLVLAVSNQDGGAHVDARLDRVYADLSRFNSLGWKFIIKANTIKSSTAPELACIRQITYELLKSLKDEFPEYF